MKKFISVFICVCTLVCSCTFFVDASSLYPVKVKKINEYDVYSEYSKMTDKQLKKEGLTQGQIKYIRKFNFEDAIKYRASLSDETLESYGYSKKEIEELRTVASSDKISEADIRSISESTLKSYLRAIKRGKDTSGSDTINYYCLMEYKFKWNRPPFFTFVDSVAIAYKTENSREMIYQRVFDGGNIIASDYSRYKLKVDYYNSLSGEDYSEYYEWELDDSGSAISASFYPGINNYYTDPNTDQTYSIICKSGSGWFRLGYKYSSTAPYFCAKYGHSLITLEPSFSISAPFDINFSFGVDTQTQNGWFDSDLTVNANSSHTDGIFGVGDTGYKTYL
ncbi:MAG: helix-turn-helix transcriptional regulator [Ruminococcaceae bacterium]|nr:helix-turn-helix transcriptional regulator [Oscillospiraceae bacterium]